MTKKKTMFRTLYPFASIMTMIGNQSGHIGFGPRFRLMAPDDDQGGGGGGGGAGGDANKNADGSYKAEFVQKLLQEKNNHRDAKVKLEQELKALKDAPPKKDDEGKPGDDPKLKELLRVKDEEYKKTKDQLDVLQKERTDGVKLGALREEFEKNGGDPKKFPLIQRLAETSKIIIDEDSGVVYGSEGEIKRIKELAPELFGKAKKGVNDGDTTHNDRHDQEQTGDDAFSKALDGKRLGKDKEGKNPFEALYAAKGLKVQATRP